MLKCFNVDKWYATAAAATTTTTVTIWRRTNQKFSLNVTHVVACHADPHPCYVYRLDTNNSAQRSQPKRHKKVRNQARRRGILAMLLFSSSSSSATNQPHWRLRGVLLYHGPRKLRPIPTQWPQICCSEYDRRKKRWGPTVCIKFEDWVCSLRLLDPDIWPVTSNACRRRRYVRCLKSLKSSPLTILVRKPSIGLHNRAHNLQPFNQAGIFCIVLRKCNIKRQFEGRAIISFLVYQLNDALFVRWLCEARWPWPLTSWP